MKKLFILAFLVSGAAHAGVFDGGLAAPPQQSGGDSISGSLGNSGDNSVSVENSVNAQLHLSDLGAQSTSGTNAVTNARMGRYKLNCQRISSAAVGNALTRGRVACRFPDGRIGTAPLN